MPMVNGKKFSYTPKGKAMAKRAMKKTSGKGGGVKSFFSKLGKKK